MSNLQPATYRNANNRQTEEQLGLGGYPFVGAAAWSASNLQYQSLLVDINGNLQVSGGITGIFNENLTQVGGVAYSLGQKAMAASMPMVIASDQSEVASKIADGSNIAQGAIADAAVITDAAGTLSAKLRGLVKILASVWDSVVGSLRITIAATRDIVDAANSSIVPLVGNEIFTGTWTNELRYSQISVIVFSDVAGTLSVQFSIDGIIVDHAHTYNVIAGVSKEVQINAHGSFYRVVYTNGAVAQTTLRLQTILNVLTEGGSVVEAAEQITAADNCVVTKSVLTGVSIDGTGFKDVKTSPDGGLVINQDIQIDATNSSTANLAVGATFTGATQSNIIATQIQVLLKSDQNCTVFVDQGSTNAAFEVTDSFRYFHSKPNFAININAVGAFYRIRVTNIGIATTTQFTLQTITVPILETLPRSLSPDGWLQTAVNHHEDDNGSVQYLTPFGETLAVPIYHLTGAVFNGSVLDTTAWTAVTGTGGIVTPTNGTLELTTGTTANNAVSLQSNFTGRFVSGAPHQFRCALRLGDAGTINNIRRWGCFSTTDGVFFELNGTTFNLCVIKNSVITRIANGSFNGTIGNAISVDTIGHFYQLVFTPANVLFLYDNELLHKQSFLQTAWTSTLDLPVRLENTNSGGLATSLSMFSTVATLLREGIPDSQPISIFQSGITAGIVCKIGSGNVRKMTVSAVTNNAVITLYDNTAASGRILYTTGALGAQTNPFPVDLDRGPFNIGLTLVISGATANVYLTLE